MQRYAVCLCIVTAMFAAPGVRGDVDADTKAALNKELIRVCGGPEGSVETVADLLARGADITAANADGESLLHVTSIFGRTELLEYLLAHGLEHGDHVNRRATGAKSLRMAPLHWWMFHGHHNGVMQLLVAGADWDMAVDTEAGGRITPMDIAKMMGREDYFELLRPLGARTYEETQGEL